MTGLLPFGALRILPPGLNGIRFGCRICAGSTDESGLRVFLEGDIEWLLGVFEEKGASWKVMWIG